MVSETGHLNAWQFQESWTPLQRQLSSQFKADRRFCWFVIYLAKFMPKVDEVMEAVRNLTAKRMNATDPWTWCSFHANQRNGHHSTASQVLHQKNSESTAKNWKKLLRCIKECFSRKHWHGNRQQMAGKFTYSSGHVILTTDFLLWVSRQENRRSFYKFSSALDTRIWRMESYFVACVCLLSLLVIACTAVDITVENVDNHSPF